MWKSSSRVVFGFLALLSVSGVVSAAPSPPRDPSKEGAEAPKPKGPSGGVQPTGKAVSPPRDPAKDGAEAPKPKEPSEGVQPEQK